jgi:Cu(I)/Ag(I) efflux system membrane fusion protein
VSSLKWPAMTMEFVVANPTLMKGIKTGSKVSFEFVERQPGEWVITTIAVAATTAVPPANSHAGH